MNGFKHPDVTTLHKIFRQGWPSLMLLAWNSVVAPQSLRDYLSIKVSSNVNPSGLCSVMKAKGPCQKKGDNESFVTNCVGITILHLESGRSTAHHRLHHFAHALKQGRFLRGLLSGHGAFRSLWFRPVRHVQERLSYLSQKAFYACL